MRRSRLLTVFLAAVLVALAGASTAFAVLDKKVTVTVDGVPYHVRTLAGSVGAVLDRMDVGVGPHDVVVPDEAASVHNGSRIVVKRARLLSLTVNGQQRQVWVTGRNVAEALGELGLRADGEYLSASRSLRIPRRGLSLEVRTPQRVMVLVDGNLLKPTTTAQTVAQLLDDVHVQLAPTDQLSVDKTAYPTDGMVIRVTRIRQRRLLDSQEIPFQTVERSDASLYKGTRKVVQEGVPGVKVLDYVLTLRNGKEVGRTLMNAVVKRQPQPRIVAVGTKARPQHAPSADGLNWSALAQCESGGNPRAVSSGGTYRGLYQFDMQTWHGVGGQGDPIDASPNEQTYRAQILYRERGDSPWPVCGHYLYS